MAIAPHLVCTSRSVVWLEGLSRFWRRDGSYKIIPNPGWFLTSFPCHSKHSSALRFRHCKPTTALRSHLSAWGCVCVHVQCPRTRPHAPRCAVQERAGENAEGDGASHRRASTSVSRPELPGLGSQNRLAYTIKQSSCAWDQGRSRRSRPRRGRPPRRRAAC